MDVDGKQVSIEILDVSGDNQYATHYQRVRLFVNLNVMLVVFMGSWFHACLFCLSSILF